MIQQVDQGRAHRMIIFRAEHDVAIGCTDRLSQCVQLRSGLAAPKCEVRFEHGIERDLERVDDAEMMARRGNTRRTRTRNAQTKAWRRRRAAETRASKKQQD